MDISSLPTDIINLLFFSTYQGMLAGFVLYHTSKTLRGMIGIGMIKEGLYKETLALNLQKDAAAHAKWTVVKWLITQFTYGVKKQTIFQAIRHDNSDLL